MHLTPTSASWLSRVERFLALITEKQIRRGVHQSVAQLKATITGFIEQQNVNPRPFRWTKSASDILANVERFCIRSCKPRLPGNEKDFRFKALATGVHWQPVCQRAGLTPGPSIAMLPAA